MERLCEEYDRTVSRGNVDPLVVIPVFIHNSLCIHPFNDGNGRISRSSVEAGLKALCDEGVIQKLGGGRSTCYIRLV